MNARNTFIIVAALAAAAGWLLRYDVQTGAQGSSLIVNRWTGSRTFCTPRECWLLPDRVAAKPETLDMTGLRQLSPSVDIGQSKPLDFSDGGEPLDPE